MAEFININKIPKESYLKPISSMYETHHSEYIVKHQNEAAPLDCDPFSLALVSRAYKELSNGNLTEKLLSLAIQEIPNNEFRLYIAVNNTRPDAILADIFDRYESILENLSDDKKQEQYENYLKEHSLKFDDINELGYTSLEELKGKVQAYRENQATLKILNSLTTAVNALYSLPIDDQNVAINQALTNIRDTASSFLSESQLKVLLQVCETIIKKKIYVVGVDCSSLNKSYFSRNHGKATNEATHLAIQQGAQYIDISDMDEFHGKGDLNEILSLAKMNRYDVIIRPLRVIVPTHPEQVPDNDDLWANLVDFYHTSLNRYQKSYGSYGSLSSGTQIVSVKAFKLHEYPEQGYNEDFNYALQYRNDPSLRKYRVLESELLLSNRKRPESFDGQQLIIDPNETVEQKRLLIENLQLASIKELVLKDNEIINNLKTFPDLIAAYKQERARFFKRNQKQKERMRREFLGINKQGKLISSAILPRLFRTFQAHPDWDAEQIVHNTKLKARQMVFLEQNPLLVKGVLNEIKRLSNIQSKSNANYIIQTSADEVSLNNVLALVPLTQHIINSIPELFGEVLDEEPLYNLSTINFNTVISSSTTDWNHLYQAEVWIKSYITNLIEEGKLPHDASSLIPGY